MTDEAVPESTVCTRSISAPHSQQRAFVLQPLWWAGFGGLLIGNVTDWVALAFAAASLITPVGATTIVANMWMSQWLLGETLTRRDVAGTCLIMVGVILVALFSSRAESCASVDTLLALYLEPGFLGLAAGGGNRAAG